MPALNVEFGETTLAVNSRYSSRVSAVRRQIFHFKVSATAAEYALSALIHRFAVTVFHHLRQESAICLYTVHQIVEFRELDV